MNRRLASGAAYLQDISSNRAVSRHDSRAWKMQVRAADIGGFARLFVGAGRNRKTGTPEPRGIPLTASVLKERRELYGEGPLSVANRAVI